MILKPRSELWPAILMPLGLTNSMKPENMLENPEDVKRVKDAIAVVLEFEEACENQIDGFLQ